MFWPITILVLIGSFYSAYLAGYHSGSKDALDWDFAAVVGGKVIPIGRGPTLLRSRLDVRPARNINMVSSPAINWTSSRESGVQPKD